MNEILEFLQENFWATATVLGGIGATLTTAIVNITAAKGFWKQFIGWFIAVILTVGAYLCDMIVVSEPKWLAVGCTGIVVGLVSNGIYDIPAIKELLKKLFSFLIPKNSCI